MLSSGSDSEVSQIVASLSSCLREGRGVGRRFRRVRPGRSLIRGASGGKMSGRLGGGVDGGEERGEEEIKQKSDMPTMTPTRWLKR